MTSFSDIYHNIAHNLQAKEMENYKTSAVIVAAGSSTRMKSYNKEESKQFIDLSGKPVVLYSLLAFEACSKINEIVLVCRREDIQQMADLCAENNITKIKSVVVGGETRQQSVQSGVYATGKTDFVAIHDGARPLITTEQIELVIRDAYKYGYAAAACPVKDTLKKVDINGDILSTIARENVYAVTTPQIFNKAKYVQALNKALKRNCDYTDDCQIIEGIYGKIKIVDIGYENIKITTPIDLTLAKAILVNREKRAKNENW